jgi:hypothetical protein
MAKICRLQNSVQSYKSQSNTFKHGMSSIYLLRNDKFRSQAYSISGTSTRKLTKPGTETQLQPKGGGGVRVVVR